MNEQNKYAELLELTKEVRRLQKAFFKTRDSSYLKTAKIAEIKLDDWIERNEKTIIPKTHRLF